jgi:hypothetical protein
MKNMKWNQISRKAKKTGLIAKRPSLVNYPENHSPVLKTSGTTGHLPSPHA